MKIAYRVTFYYEKAWRARETALEDVYGCPEESYVLLPLYFYMLETRNPRTFTRIQKDKYNRYGLQFYLVYIFALFRTIWFTFLKYFRCLVYVFVLFKIIWFTSM